MTQWTRAEGMIIARQLDPTLFAADLEDRNVLAQMEWFDRTPELMGLKVMLSDGPEDTPEDTSQDTPQETPQDTAKDTPGNDATPNNTPAPTRHSHVGVIKDGHLTPGPLLQDFARDLATKHHVEVRIGQAHADELPAGNPVEPPADQDATQEPPVSRIVEIGHTPASSVPLLAGLEGVDIADYGLDGGARALLAELPAERSGWNFGELPLVTLSMTGQEFQVLLVVDDHIEHVVSFNWGMRHQTVAPAGTPEDVSNLVTDRDNIDQIASHVPGADADALFAATRQDHPWAVRAVCRALNLPSAFADYLLGTATLETIPEVEIHHARGVSNAIGRSVDIMLTDSQSAGGQFWRAYENTAMKRPWLVRAAASTEAAVGATLVGLTVAAESPRSGWRKFGAVVGALMLIDSIAELSLVKYVRARTKRHQ